MKVTLCGVALSAFVSSITAAILILDEQTLLAMRTWLAGDLAGQDWATLGTSAWFSLGGFVLALYLAPSLNMLALGDRMAQGLGVSVLRTRTFTLLAIALLCGAAVSIAGPIGLSACWYRRLSGVWYQRICAFCSLFQLVSAHFCYYWQILLPGRFSRPMS